MISKRAMGGGYLDHYIWIKFAPLNIKVGVYGSRVVGYLRKSTNFHVVRPTQNGCAQLN